MVMVGDGNSNGEGDLRMRILIGEDKGKITMPLLRFSSLSLSTSLHWCQHHSHTEDDGININGGFHLSRHYLHHIIRCARCKILRAKAEAWF